MKRILPAQPFEINEEQIGQIFLNKSPPRIRLNEENFFIKKAGFWRNNIEIENGNGAIVLGMHYKKWYSNEWIIHFENQTYQLKVRNKPLSEYVLCKDGQEIPAYSLDTIRIANHKNDIPALFDFLLWYLSEPITKENEEQDFLLLLLLTSA